MGCTGCTHSPECTFKSTKASAGLWPELLRSSILCGFVLAQSLHASGGDSGLEAASLGAEVLKGMLRSSHLAAAAALWPGSKSPPGFLGAQPPEFFKNDSLVLSQHEERILSAGACMAGAALR